MKTCTGCRQLLPLEAFNRNWVTSDGRETRCRACRRAYYDANREHFLAYQAAYHAAHSEKVRAWKRTTYANRRARDQAHCEEIREREREAAREEPDR